MICAARTGDGSPESSTARLIVKPFRSGPNYDLVSRSHLFRAAARGLPLRPVEAYRKRNNAAWSSRSLGRFAFLRDDADRRAFALPLSRRSRPVVFSSAVQRPQHMAPTAHSAALTTGSTRSRPPRHFGNQDIANPAPGRDKAATTWVAGSAGRRRRAGSRETASAPPLNRPPPARSRSAQAPRRGPAAARRRARRPAPAVSRPPAGADPRCRR